MSEQAAEGSLFCLPIPLSEGYHHPGDEERRDATAASVRQC